MVASTVLSQRVDGDQWHEIAEVSLSPLSEGHVRLRCTGPAPCVADAVYVRSSARYNDGSPAEVVVLQPMDGIVLARAE